MRRRRTGLCLALGAGTVLLLAGACDGTSDGGSAGGPPAPGESTPAILKGARLKGMLLPAAEVPKGLKADAEATRDSAETVADPVISALPGGKGACKDMQATGWIDVSKIQGAAFAQGTFASDDGSKQFGQEIDVFHPGEGEQVMRRIRTMMKRCAAFTYQDQGNTAHIRGKAGKVSGFEGDGLKMLFTAPEFVGGTAIAAVRVGDTVVTTVNSYTGTEGGVAAKTATKIARNVQAAS